MVWNFLKHNSKKAYDVSCNFHPDMVYDPKKLYRNGNLALSVLKLDERYIINTLKELPLFFDEVCRLGFDENTDDASWDYEEYFLELVNKKIENNRIIVFLGNKKTSFEYAIKNEYETFVDFLFRYCALLT